MKKINVIDLDKTLIPYDSFEKLVKKEIRHFNLIAIYLTILRVLRFIPPGNYKEKITNLMRKKYGKTYFVNFAKNLYNDIDSLVLEEVHKESDYNTINVIISASPDLYVNYLVEEMNWVGLGSYFDENKKFIHLHGIGKIIWLKENFPVEDFQYNLAISDSSSDDELLKLFKKEIKWISH